MKPKSKTLIFAVCACLPVLILFFLFYLIPLVTTIVTSFSDWSQIRIQGFSGFNNYVRLFNDRIFYVSLKNNLSWLAIAVFVHIPFALLVAILLSEKPPAWELLRTAYFIPQIISSVAWATIFLSVFNPRYGLLNGILRMVRMEHLQRNWLFDARTAWPSIISTWLFFIGMYAMIVLAELISIPEEIIESARIDGANKIQVAFYIKLPMIRIPTSTILILTVSGGIKHFDSLYVMTNGAPNYRTETLALYLYQQYSYADFSYANTIGVFLLIFGITMVTLVRKVMRTNEKVH
jgi:raffinose/stachyose/melibiose transport system permease protein